MPYCSVCGKRISHDKVVTGSKNIFCSKECMYDRVKLRLLKILIFVMIGVSAVLLVIGLIGYLVDTIEPLTDSLSRYRFEERLENRSKDENKTNMT
jgi:hypothetical protein